MRGKGLHVLFVVALASLIALGAWWSLFIRRAVDETRQHRLDDLEMHTRIAVLTLNRAESEPPQGPLAGYPQLSVSSRCNWSRWRLHPRWPGLCVVPAPGTVAAIVEKHDSQLLMVTGESALLLLLIGICIVMLHRVVVNERRFRRKMDQFFSIVTHELKTPIAGIRALLQSIQLGRVPDGEVEQLASMGVREADRLEHLVENILFSDRLRRRRAAIAPERVVLGPFMDRLVEHRLQMLGPDSGERLVLDGDRELAVRVTPEALRVVMENLLDNALKYGGEAPVRVILAAAGDEIAIRVEDRGVGFTPEQAEELFDAYRRERPTDGVVRHGTGLGLSLARGLARRMGGELTAASEGPGRGSRFTLTLPGAQS